jgi:hypothetical protein
LCSKFAALPQIAFICEMLYAAVVNKNHYDGGNDVSCNSDGGSINCDPGGVLHAGKPARPENVEPVRFGPRGHKPQQQPIEHLPFDDGQIEQIEHQRPDDDGKVQQIEHQRS